MTDNFICSKQNCCVKGFVLSKNRFKIFKYFEAFVVAESVYRCVWLAITRLRVNGEDCCNKL